MSGTVKVLIVDDSAYMRVVLRDMLQAEDGITVVGTAKDGVEAIDKVKELEPDVVLLDIQMPKMDGLATLQRLMKESPARAVMLSAMDKIDHQLPLKALAMGAVDFVPKPSGPVSIDIIHLRSKIAETVKNAAIARIDALKMIREPLKTEHIREPVAERKDSEHKAIVIAASTGGPRSLEAIFTAIPRHLPAAVFVVQHIPAEFSRSFAGRLDAAKGPKTVLAKDGEPVERETAYIAPGGYHLRLERNSRKGVVLRLDEGPPVNFVRPSADILFETAAKCYSDRLLAIVMTGMGSDGAAGARAVREAGGRVIAQNEETSVIFGMARKVIADGMADEVVPLNRIPRKIVSFIEG